MLHSSHYFTLFHINLTKGCHCSCSLFIHMGRGKRIWNLQVLLDHFSKNRHAVTKEYYLFPSRIQFLNHLSHWNCHLSFYRYQLMLLKAVNSCINLTSSCIHNRADQCSGIIQIICQCIHSGNFHQRLFQRKTKSLGCSRTDTKSCKRAWSGCHCNGINGIQIQLCHLHQLVQHRKKCLGMCLFIINCIFRNQVLVLHYCNRSDDS